MKTKYEELVEEYKKSIKLENKTRLKKIPKEEHILIRQQNRNLEKQIQGLISSVIEFKEMSPGNYYGSLNIGKAFDKYFWCVECGVNGFHWEEIPKHVYDALLTIVPKKKK